MRKIALFVGVMILFSLAVEAKTTIHLWLEWERPHFREQVGRFNETHDDIEIEYQVVTGLGADTEGKLHLAVAGGAPPHLILAWNDSLPLWVHEGILTPLNEFAERAGLSRDDLVPAAWDQWVHNSMESETMLSNQEPFNSNPSKRKSLLQRFRDSERYLLYEGG